MSCDPSCCRHGTSHPNMEKSTCIRLNSRITVKVNRTHRGKSVEHAEYPGKSPKCQSRASDRRPPTIYGKFRLPNAKGGKDR